jgi:L-ascorbate metabolism protein UlaG (beta-lactamase superfamily)
VFFGRPQANRKKISRYLETLPGKLQAVIVGHTHLDHALDVPEILSRFPVPLVGSESLEALMSLHGMPGKVTVCSERTRLDLPGGASVTMIPSLYGLVFFGRPPYGGEIGPGQRLPLKALHYRHGRMFIPRLEVGGKSFLHVGSANLIDEQIEGQTCDVLFLCLPGWRMILNYHRRILSRVHPKIAIPFHFDDFSAPLSKDFRAPSLPWRSEKLFMDRIAEEAPDARIIHPDLFKPFVF